MEWNVQCCKKSFPQINLHISCDFNKIQLKFSQRLMYKGINLKATSTQKLSLAKYGIMK